MAKARIAIELLLEASNGVGILAEVASKIAKEAINIEGISAYVIDDKAYFRLVVSDVEGAKSALSDFRIEESEVVVVELENRVGAAGEIVLKLKEANINLSYAYGSACASIGESRSFFVFSSNNNQKAADILK